MLIRVLLADGCAFTRDGLLGFLEQHQIAVIGQAHDWEELVHLIEKYSPQVIILGSNLQGLSGPADFAMKQRGVVTPPHWLVFGEQDTLETAHAWLEAGAEGYTWKGEPREWMLAAIQTVKEGQPWISPNLKGGDEADLSPHERQLLIWLAQGHKNKWVACQRGVALRTVKYHLSRVYGKLGVSGRAEAVACAVRHGLAAEVRGICPKRQPICP